MSDHPEYMSEDDERKWAAELRKIFKKWRDTETGLDTCDKIIVNAMLEKSDRELLYPFIPNMDDFTKADQTQLLMMINCVPGLGDWYDRLFEHYYGPLSSATARAG